MGNWKCHKSISEALSFLDALALEGRQLSRTELVLFPTLPALVAMSQHRRCLDGSVSLGGQCVSASGLGAHTGELAAELLADAGARFVLVGHSERRADQGESGALARAKLAAARDAGLRPVLCVGETLDERRGQRTEHRLRQQLREELGELREPPAGLIVAYEPVWAIGTGLVPERSQLVDAAGALRSALEQLLGERGCATPLLYGGSVKSSNIAPILDGTGYDGALIGGASLDPVQLTDIVGLVA